MKVTLRSPEAQVLARELLRQHEKACRPYGLRKPKEVTDGAIERSVITHGTLCDRAGVPFLTHVAGNDVAP
jgi:hypothetical protein